MHSAPAVRYPVARSARAGLALAACWGLACVTCMGWWLAGAASQPHMAAASACLLLGAAVAVVQWRCMPVGALRWDGQAWWWQAQGGEKAVSVQISLDLQHAALLQLGGMPFYARWAYVEQASQPARWDDLRRALYSPGSGKLPAHGAVSKP